MLNKIKTGIKKALSSKPIAYTAKKKAPMSRGVARVSPKKRPFKAPNYRGANFIK